MEWLLHLPMLWMGFVIFAIIYLLAAAVFWSATRLIGDRGRLVDPGTLSPLGVVFGLLIVFTAAQVWGDLERANSAVADEASALRDIFCWSPRPTIHGSANSLNGISMYLKLRNGRQWRRVMRQ